MPIQPSTTAILFFSNSVEEEARRKHLLSGNKNRELLKALRTKSLNTLRESDFPVFEYSEKHQTGSTFGERISNAMEEVFAQGYDRLICVGSDCPELSLANIQQANNSLETDDLVLGPDFRGGVFLIGIRKEAFEKRSFSELKWNSKDLIRSFISYGKGLNVHFLEARFDLNRGSELLRYAIASPVLQRLLRLVNSLSRPIPMPAPRFHTIDLLWSDFLRGPPNLA